MKNLKKANEFRIARELARAINGMTSLELRVLFSFFAIREKEELELTVTYQELMELLDIKRGGKQDLKTQLAMDSLMVKTKITIPKELSRTGNKISCFIIPEVEWLDDDDKSKGAIIRFSDKVTPLLDDLKDNYDFYLLSQMARFTSSDYSALIYQFCNSILPLKQKSVTYIWWIEKSDKNPDSFREWTGTLDKYKQFGDLNTRVIKPAFEEINEKSDLSIKYSFKKKGKSVIGLNLIISRKDKIKEVVDVLPLQIVESEILESFYQELNLACDNSFDNKQLKAIHSILSQIHSPEHMSAEESAKKMINELRMAYAITMARDNVTSPFNYVIAILKNKVTGSVPATESVNKKSYRRVEEIPVYNTSTEGIEVLSNADIQANLDMLKKLENKDDDVLPGQIAFEDLFK